MTSSGYIARSFSHDSDMKRKTCGEEGERRCCGIPEPVALQKRSIFLGLNRREQLSNDIVVVAVFVLSPPIWWRARKVRGIRGDGRGAENDTSYSSLVHACAGCWLEEHESSSLVRVSIFASLFLKQDHEEQRVGESRDRRDVTHAARLRLFPRLIISPSNGSRRISAVYTWFNCTA